jgi:glycosyltransferase involved in cell wall biosynthesis
VQSIYNLVGHLKNDYDFYLVSLDKDYDGSHPENALITEVWSEGPQEEHIYYTRSLSFGLIRKLMSEVKPDVVYVNGLFNISTTIPGVLHAKRHASKLIIAPRGMLQEGALSLKALKKKVFLFLLKISGLVKNIRWHATDEQERKDIQKVFGSGEQIVVATNIPRRPTEKLRRPKMKGNLRMVFLSLIAEKKNLHVTLEALKLIKTRITFHIYGPIKDQAYWEQCQLLMKGPIHDINYEGSANPNEVPLKLSAYDVFVLATKGENFGHAIYEALSVGTPVIISKHTPWKVDDCGAGVVVQSEKQEDWASAIQNVFDFDKTQHDEMSKRAYKMATDFFNDNDFRSQYVKLFSIN